MILTIVFLPGTCEIDWSAWLKIEGLPEYKRRYARRWFIYSFDILSFNLLYQVAMFVGDISECRYCWTGDGTVIDFYLAFPLLQLLQQYLIKRALCNLF